MATFKNTAAGMRGVNLKDGTTVWIDAGETAEIDASQIADKYEGVEAVNAKDAAAKDAA